VCDKGKKNQQSLPVVEMNICIIGAGPAGCAAALQLDKLGISCTLIDKSKFPRDKICGDAESGKVVSLLNRIDPEIISSLEKKTIQIGSWGVKFVAPNGRSLRVPFRKNIDQATQPPGFICRRIDFDNHLAECVRKKNAVQFLEGMNIGDYEKSKNGWIIYDDKKNIIAETRLLIIADGAHSHFARHYANLEQEPEHYCAGLRVYYEGVSDLDEENFIELFFINKTLPGYFWIFPLSNGCANVGIGVHSKKVSREKINLKKALNDIIENHPAIKLRFANAKAIDSVRGYGLPLGSKKRKISGDHYLLTGDAASLIDPFTGEGIGNAILSGIEAAKIAATCTTKNDFSSTATQVYDKNVYDHLWQELQISSQLKRLAGYPWLFNMVINKANKSKLLSETISGMFEDLDLRSTLKNPSFYLKLLFSKQ
jgi:menaquinone-9 beta-reductase